LVRIIDWYGNNRKKISNVISKLLISVLGEINKEKNFAMELAKEDRITDTSFNDEFIISDDVCFCFKQIGEI